MTLNQDIFAVKLYEMEKQYGRLQIVRCCLRIYEISPFWEK